MSRVAVPQQCQHPNSVHLDDCRRYNKPHYDGLVDKMRGCGNPEKMDSIAYRCLQCGVGKHPVSMRCQSSLCWRRATVYVDNWVSQVSRMLHEGVISRYIVLTLPAMLRTTFSHNATVLLSAFMRCGVRCLDGVFTRVSGRELKGGSIVVIQTHGRNGQYHPSLHIIATSGGWDHKASQWVHLDDVPYPLLRKKRQWSLLRNFHFLCLICKQLQLLWGHGQGHRHRLFQVAQRALCA